MRKHVGIIRLWGKNDNEFSQERQEAGQENVNECGLRHIWLCGKGGRNPQALSFLHEKVWQNPVAKANPLQREAGVSC